jgi:hypothetical protein
MTHEKQPDDDTDSNLPGADDEGWTFQPQAPDVSTSAPDPDAPLFPTPTMKVVTGSGGPQGGNDDRPEGKTP